jgi:hypothetical protein
VSRVFETYEEAADNHDPDTEMVCGVRLDDESVRYFVMPREADDEVGYERAFEIRHGRPMSSYERWLREIVLDRHAKEPAGA